MSKKKRFIELKATFRLEVSQEIHDKIYDSPEALDLFIVNNCFRNNRRYIESSNVEDLKLYFVKNPKQANEDQISDEGYLSYRYRPYLYRLGEARKKAKMFDGEVIEAPPNETFLALHG